ncbi:MAG TPA: response regulator transcription factor [Thermomicrobiales bacterium]|nr:response regulator transcription factor [Thermomicrobiales bacterium]
MLAQSTPATAHARSFPPPLLSPSPEVLPPACGRHCGPALSPREHEIMLLLIEGLTDKEIGAALGISPRTVTTHVTSIYNKLGVFSRVAATTYAFRHGLV